MFPVYKGLKVISGYLWCYLYMKYLKKHRFVILKCEQLLYLVKTFCSSGSSHVARMEHRAPCKHIFCPYTHPWPLGWGQNICLKDVMLHIKLKGMEPRAPCKHIFCPYTHPWPLGWGQNICLKDVMLHIKLKGMEPRAPCKHIFCPFTYPRLVGSGLKVKTFFF